MIFFRKYVECKFARATSEGWTRIPTYNFPKYINTNTASIISVGFHNECLRRVIPTIKFHQVIVSVHFVHISYPATGNVLNVLAPKINSTMHPVTNSFYLKRKAKGRNISSFALLNSKILNSKKILELPFKEANAISIKRTISKKESLFQYLFIQYINNNNNQKKSLGNLSIIPRSSCMRCSHAESKFDHAAGIASDYATQRVPHLFDPTNKMNIISENFPNQSQIFINYRKPFLCYWLIPFIGLVTILPSSFKNNNNLLLTQEAFQQNLLKENNTFMVTQKYTSANSLQNEQSVNILFKHKPSSFETSSYNLNQLHGVIKNVAGPSKISNFKKIMDLILFSTLNDTGGACMVKFTFTDHAGALSSQNGTSCEMYIRSEGGGQSHSDHFIEN